MPSFMMVMPVVVRAVFMANWGSGEGLLRHGRDAEGTEKMIEMNSRETDLGLAKRS